MRKKMKSLFTRIASCFPWEMGYGRNRYKKYGQSITEEIYFIGNEKNVTTDPFWKLAIDLSLLPMAIIAMVLIIPHFVLRIFGKKGFFQLNPFHFNTEGALLTIEK